MRTSDVEESLDATPAEEQARIRRQLERVLAHTSFRNSKRYQAFLRYVVEEKLQGNSLHLKERMIGVSVFNQSLSYDTNSNSVVRVTAGEIRRRLAQYYAEASLEDEIVIELPLGSYVPEFRLHEPVPPTEVILPNLERQLPSFAEEPEKRDILIVQESAAPPRPASWSRTVIALCVAVCLLAALFAAMPAIRESTSETDRLWRGAFGRQNVLLCAGALDDLPPSPTDPHAQHTSRSVSFTIARTAVMIGSAIGHAGGNALLLPEKNTTFEDLQRSPVVLIGAFNNEWTLKLQAPLRYQLFRSPDGSLSGVLDTKDPASKRFIIDPSQPNQHTRDYGILAHFQSPTTGQSTIIAAGLEMHGTAAVRMFISSPELLKEFSKSAPNGWEKRNYEIVLASDLVNNLADPPKVVEAYFW